MYQKSKNFKIKKYINQKVYYGSTPLHTEFPGVPRSTPVNYKWSEPTVTNVEGIRVVAIESNTPQTSVTLSFHSGSRVENTNNLGTAALLKSFSHKATPKHTQVGISRAIELNTVSFNSAVSREDISYNARLARYQMESFFPVLGEISQPKIREFEVRELEPIVLEESSNHSSCVVNLLVDRLHRIAYRSEGLGNAISPNVSRASLEHDEWVEALREYRDKHFLRERAVVVGVGYGQQELIELVHSNFGALARGTDEAPKSSKYYGGEHLGDRSGSTHLLIGFEGLPVVSPLNHALGLVYTVLGRGSRSGSEWPGSGRTSLLNRNVVEKYSNVHSVSTYNVNYRDSGLFGIYVNADGQLASVVDSVYEQINALSKVENSQLDNAKRQFKIQLSNCYGSLQKRAELAKRFVLAGLPPVSVEKFISSVDNVTLEDFRRVAKNVFGSRPVLVAEGNLAGLPGTEQLAKKIN